MPCPVEKILSLPLSAKILIAANLAALACVLTLQYGFGVKPCILCLWQRAPYVAAAVFALAAWAWKPYRRPSAILLALCAGCYVAGIGLGIFHSGVEMHWWLGTSSCGIEPLQGGSAADMRAALLKTVAPRCDEVTWTLFGLSLANMNIAASLFLAFFAAAAAAKAPQN